MEQISSLEIIYSREVIDRAKAAMENAVAVYGGRRDAQIVKAGGKVCRLGGSALLDGDTVLAPQALFVNEFAAKTSSDGIEWFMEMNGVRLKGMAGSVQYAADGREDVFAVPVQYHDGVLYLPAAEAALACGKSVETDGRLVIIGKDSTIRLFHRTEGINEYTEVIMYLAGHEERDPDGITADDCRQAIDRWVRYITGDEAINCLPDPHIARKLSDIAAAGQAAREKLIRRDGQKELFSDIRTLKTGDMTRSYARVYDMALAYGTYGNVLYHQEGLKEDILYGLEWLNRNRYGQKERDGTGWRNVRLFNWWDWSIGVPERLIPVMMIMRDFLDDEQISRYLLLFDHMVPKVRDAGYNALALARLLMGAALLRGDAGKILEVQAQMDKLFLYVDNNRVTHNLLYGDRLYARGQGFYTDGSYIFHTLHPMNGTYGRRHLLETGPLLFVFAETPFAVTNPQADHAAEWIYNAFEPLIYQGAMFRMVRGRMAAGGEHAAGADFVNAALTLLDTFAQKDRIRVEAIIKKQVSEDVVTDYYSALGLRQMAELSRIMEDDAIQPRGEYLKNHIYRNMDKAIHQRGNYAVGISMSSARMFNYECINFVNMRGWYLGDGMVEYHVKGDFLQGSDDYWNRIDPYRLPGTTVDTRERAEVSIAQGNEYLSGRHFVGGVSDGEFGAAAMWLEAYHNDTDYGIDNGEYGGPAPARKSSLQAKKSYFMFDDAVVMLGSGICSSDGAEVITIADNRLLPDGLRNNRVIVDGQEKEITGTDMAMPGAGWLYLEGTGGYCFPEGGSLFARRTGETGGFLELWFSHGTDPWNETYAYMLLPNKTAGETEAYAADPAAEILANTPALQAVREKNLGITEMVFWESGECGGLRVNRPLMVMLRETEEGLTLSVADPTWLLQSAEIVLAGSYEADRVDERMDIASGSDTVVSVCLAGAQGRTMTAVLRRAGEGMAF